MQKIGEGGFGTVYTVKDSKGSVFVAKHQNHFNSKDYNAAEKEAVFLQKIKHPNIVNLIDSFSNKLEC